ncbi:MAG: FAD-binding oxidoreductase, partial [Thermoplasmata archaeon]
MRKSEEKVIARFESLLGKGRVLTAGEDVEPYSHDESVIEPSPPACALYPKTADEVTGIVSIAGEESFPLTPRGGGTGLSGGAIPVRGGAVVSFEKMDRIIDIDEADNMAVVEPGVINGVLQREAEGRGLFYPVNPASMDSCTIGGNVATACGGANAVRHGTTRNYVCGLSAVLADSRRVSLGGRVYKNVTDDKMIHAIIGSEGILALISEVTLKLLPKPGFVVDLIGSFPDFESVSRTVQKIFRTGHLPTMVELMDHKALAITEKYLEKSLPFPNAPVSLMVRVDGSDGEAFRLEYERVGEILLENGASDVLVAEEESERKRIWEARSSIHDALAHVAGIVSNEDVVV